MLHLHSIGYSADIYMMKLKNKNIWKVCQPVPVSPVQLSGLPQVVLIKYVNYQGLERMFYNLAFFTATTVLEIGP